MIIVLRVSTYLRCVVYSWREELQQYYVITTQQYKLFTPFEGTTVFLWTRRPPWFCVTSAASATTRRIAYIYGVTRQIRTRTAPSFQATEIRMSVKTRLVTHSSGVSATSGEPEKVGESYSTRLSFRGKGLRPLYAHVSACVTFR